MFSKDSNYMRYDSKNCYTDNGSGNYQIEYPVGTGIDECIKECDAMPFGVGENHCSCMILRDNGQCYLKDGADASGCVMSQCTDDSTWNTYIRGMLCIYICHTSQLNLFF